MNKLIKLSDIHYIGVDGSEIKERDYFLYGKNIYCADKNTNKNFVYKNGIAISILSVNKITHSTEPLEYIHIAPKVKGLKLGYNKIKPLSLTEIEEAVYGYSVENIAKQILPDDIDWQRRFDIIKGFKAHQELVKDKFILTEKQLNNILSNSLYHGSCRTEEHENKNKINKIIQSLLPKTEWDVEIDEQGKIKLL